MCGIFGYTFKDGAIGEARRAILGNNLARLNDRRGGDSWGVVVLDKGEMSISRGLGDMHHHAYHFIDAPVVMGHTRFATQGSKTIENAHPFEIGNIVGAHNGVVRNHFELERKYNRQGFQVDSMHLFAHLSEKLPFSDIEGYGAIEWLDRTKPNNIYLSKLKNGSLSIFGIGQRSAPNTQGIVWSSDEKHLLEALYCVGIKDFFPYKVEEGSVYLISDGEAFVIADRKLVLGDGVHSSGKYTGKWDDSNKKESGVINFPTSDHKSLPSKSTSFHSQEDYKLKDLTDWDRWNKICSAEENGNSADEEPN